MELMIVVTIIGILATIAVPKFADLLRKSNEGATRGNLGSMKSALSIYYADMEGVYPDTPTALTINGKYMSLIPQAKTPPYHAANNAFLLAADNTGHDDNNGWVYVNATSDSNYGVAFINCTHTDSKGSVWSSY
jgi:Tfp pilus assembly protein PilE